MANFFSAVEKLGRQSVTQPFKSIKQAAHGDVSGGVKSLFHSASKAGQDVAHSVGIRGWVGDHPMQSVGALMATIFGGWAAAGAYGAGAAGTAGAAAGGSGAAAGGAAGAAGAGASSGALFGGAGSALAYTPTASTVLGGAGSASAGSAVGAGAVSGTGASAFGGAGMSAYMAPEALGGVGATSSTAAGTSASSLFGATYFPTQSTVLGGAGSTVSGTAGTTAASTAGTSTATQSGLSTMDKVQLFQKAVSSLQSQNQQANQQSQAPQESPNVSRGGGPVDMSLFNMAPDESQDRLTQYQMPQLRNTLG